MQEERGGSPGKVLYIFPFGEQVEVEIWMH